MTRYTLKHDGLERECFVFLPSSYDDGEHARSGDLCRSGFGTGNLGLSTAI